MAARGRRGCSHDEPQHSASEGDERCNDCALSKRRTFAAVERLLDAAPVAWLRGQHEHQMATANQSYPRTDNYPRRDLALHDAAAGRQSLAVLFSAGHQISHHSAFTGPHDEGTRFL